MDWIAPVIIVACSFISLGGILICLATSGVPLFFFFAGSFSSGGFLLSLVQSCKVISILVSRLMPYFLLGLSCCVILSFSVVYCFGWFLSVFVLCFWQMD